MRKYSNLLATGLIWTAAYFCGGEDVVGFLNELPARQAASAKVVAVVDESCRVNRARAGLEPRLDDNQSITVYYLEDADTAQAKANVGDR